ncbi:MAG: hypothetical protein KBD64_08345 [Gammaproteobacteria bacterium]|nr:hypothetical protein [Gammaproteobacteria bacterium]
MYNKVSEKNDLELDLSVNSDISGITNKMSSNNLKSNLWDYINARKLNFGDKSLTHQWWNGINDLNFKIDDDEYNEFLDIYAKEFKKERKMLHIMEKPKEIGPLCLDFDLKQISPERTLCLDNIIDVIGIVNNFVAQYYTIKNNST